MTKLKTLEDLEIIMSQDENWLGGCPEWYKVKWLKFKYRSEGTYPNSYANIYELRKEAINWIKEMRRDLCDVCKNPLQFKYEDYESFYWCPKCNNNAFKWGDVKLFMDFFNITEEDLK